MAAVLCGGSGAVLSHSSAAALFQIGRERPGLIEISLPGVSHRSRSGLVLHRRPSLRCSDVGSYDDIPVTSPVQTLIDLTPRFGRSGLERAINEADKFDLVHTPDLRKALEKRAGEPGVRRLREILDRRTFRLTREELERCFLALAREAGLPVPSTGQIVNGFEVDFYWPDLGFVVETDGLRYHRTPAEQARDRLRDQTHTAAGFVNLRFTHEQVRYEPEHVREMLTSAWQLLPALAAGRAASAAA
jgi:very-short-patch-repair endonuclease